MAEDMDGKIDVSWTAGRVRWGGGVHHHRPDGDAARLLRPGGLPLEALEEVLGTVAVDKAVTGLLKDGESPVRRG